MSLSQGGCADLDTASNNCSDDYELAIAKGSSETTVRLPDLNDVLVVKADRGNYAKLRTVRRSDSGEYFQFDMVTYRINQ